MSVNLLFTSVGRRVELMRLFREARQALGLEGRLVAVDASPLAPALQAVDVRYVVPPVQSPDYLPALRKIVERESIHAVFPLIDPDIPVLSTHRGELESLGAKVAVVPPESATIVRDKWQSNRFFKSLGVDCARSWLPEHLAGVSLEYPLFIKPRDGSASQSGFRITTPVELDFFASYVPNPIVQEFLEGPEITNDVILDLDGAVLSVVSRQRIRVRAGEVAVGKTVYDGEIADQCIRIAKGLHAVGPITVQCMLHQGRRVFTEVNARLGGGAPVGVAAGSPWPQWLVAQLAGVPFETRPIGSYQTGLFFMRFDETFYATGAEYEALGSRCV
jgi:carbamoyl-phosphate synthase large subunit